MATTTKQQGPSAPEQVPSRRRDFTALLAVITATATFVVTAWFANTTFSDRSFERTKRTLKDILHVDVGDTLTVLSVLRGVLSFLMGFVLNDMLELIQWSLMGRAKGLNTLSILGLSPSTGASGTLDIIFSRMANQTTRLWAASKMIFRIAIWLSGVVLFVKTSLAVVYEPIFTYPLRAGIGPFNGSYVSSYIENFNAVNRGYKLKVVPYSDLSMVHNLVVNPIHSVISPPVNCTADDCDSYLLPGGLAVATPWPPTNYTREPVIVIHSAIGTQIEFKGGLLSGDIFQEEDCDLFGADDILIGVRFCVARSLAQTGSLIAGLYVCNGTHDGKCLLGADGYLPNLTTTFSVYERRSSIVAARTNFSILSVSDNGPPILNTNIDLTAYRLALVWLLNYTAAGIPAPSSIAEYFWSAPNQLSNEYWSIELRQAWQSILAFPLWVFNTNNYGNIALANLTDTSVLPPEYHTNASVANPYTKIVVNESMFIIFVILESTVLVFAWLVILWLFLSDQRLLKTSSYPLMDFAYKTKNVDLDEPIAMRQPFSKDPGQVGSKEVRESASNMNISIRSDVGKAPPIVKPWHRRSSGPKKVASDPGMTSTAVSAPQIPNSPLKTAVTSTAKTATSSPPNPASDVAPSPGPPAAPTSTATSPPSSTATSPPTKPASLYH